MPAIVWATWASGTLRYLRTPLDFGFHEVAGINGCDPALLQRSNLNPDRVPRSTEPLKVTTERMMRWPGSEPFAMWGYAKVPRKSRRNIAIAETGIAA